MLFLSSKLSSLIALLILYFKQIVVLEGKCWEWLMNFRVKWKSNEQNMARNVHHTYGDILCQLSKGCFNYTFQSIRVKVTSATKR